MGQGFRSDLTGWFWLRLCHEAANGWPELQSSEALTEAKGSISRWLIPMAGKGLAGGTSFLWPGPLLELLVSHHGMVAGFPENE